MCTDEVSEFVIAEFLTSLPLLHRLNVLEYWIKFQTTAGLNTVCDYDIKKKKALFIQNMRGAKITPANLHHETSSDS